MKALALVPAFALLLLGCGSPEGTVGGKVPQLRLEALANEGKFVDLDRFKGKVVLLDFWATWCGPCRESMPHVGAMYEQLKRRGFEVVGITDEERPIVSKFFGGTNPPYPIYLDGGSSANRVLQVGSYPTAILVDRNGVIVFRGHPEMPEMKEAIEKALTAEGASQTR